MQGVSIDVRKMTGTYLVLPDRYRVVVKNDEYNKFVENELLKIGMNTILKQ